MAQVIWIEQWIFFFGQKETKKKTFEGKSKEVDDAFKQDPPPTSVAWTILRDTMKARWVALDASYTALHDNLKQAKQDVDVINTWVDFSEERDELFEEYTRLNAVCEIGRDAANRREKAAISSTTSTPTTFSSSVKLHSLSLRKFSGERAEWRTFWEVFQVNVNNRTDLQGVQKFIYL